MPVEKSVSINIDKFVDDHLIEIPAPEKDMIRDFYHRTICKFADSHLQNMKNEVRFIVVGHLVPTLPFYLEALNKIGTIAAVVKKGSVPDTNISTWLKKWLSNQTDGQGVIVDQAFFGQQKEALLKEIEGLSEKKKKRLNLPLDKEGTIEPKKLGVRELLAVNGARLVESWVGNKKGIIIDIGGYFSYNLKALQKDWASKGRMIGLVEDTENGHQLYDRAISALASAEIARAAPIITVARSQIKDSEDYNVGKAITDAVDHILRITDYTHLAESKVILVIGYGKIGSAAARVAAEKTRGPVLICEIDPVRRLKASAHSFAVVDMQEGLTKADVIICCTGNQCLKSEHLKAIRNGVYIASCTSRDGEFDPSFILSLNETGIGKKLHNANETQEAGSQLNTSVEINSISLENNQREINKGMPIPEKVILPSIARYTIAGKTINLLNNGNSVNFVEKAVHGYFIHGVLASLATAAIRLYLEPLLKSEVDKPLKKGVLNDFNDLVTPQGLPYQSVISEILMGEKLRKSPLITNYNRSSARYLPKDGIVERLNKILKQTGYAHITGGKKYGKSQMVEEFFALHGSRYEIVWCFDDSSSLDMQFSELVEKIEDNKAAKRMEKIDFVKTPMKAVQRSTWNKTPPVQPQQQANRQKVLEALKKADLSYLLIFENVDILKAKGELDENELKTFIPDEPHHKREHIISTSGGKTFSSNDFQHIGLTPFPSIELFSFLINNDEICSEQNKLLLGRLTYAFVHPDRLSTEYQGGEIEHVDEGYDEFVAVSNLFAAFMRKHPNYEWQKLIKNDKPVGGYRAYFLEAVLEKLTSNARQLLSKFYILELDKVPCVLDSIVLRKSFSNEVEELIGYGLIEEIDSFLHPVLAVLEMEKTKPLHKVILEAALLKDETKQKYKENVMNATVKQFCKYRQASFLSMVKKMAEFLLKPDADAETDDCFYRDWKQKNKPQYRNLLKRLGDYHWENHEKENANNYYEIVSKDYRELCESLKVLLELPVLEPVQSHSQSANDLSNIKYRLARDECQRLYEDTDKKLKKIEERMSNTQDEVHEGIPYPNSRSPSLLTDEAAMEEDPSSPPPSSPYRPEIDADSDVGNRSKKRSVNREEDPTNKASKGKNDVTPQGSQQH